MEREPNTQYVLSLSYGKDSMATIEACRILGYPLDRIVTIEVWATDDISADLPPMVEFKTYADKIILERYGIEVEHICAMNKDGTKKTYEQMFYHVPVKRKQASKQASNPEGFPRQTIGWCRNLKGQNIDRYLRIQLHRDETGRNGILPPTQGRASGADQSINQSINQSAHRLERDSGIPVQDSTEVRGSQDGRIYGFPTVKCNWCNSGLKRGAINNLFTDRRTGRENKYGAISRHSGRRAGEDSATYREAEYPSPAC